MPANQLVSATLEQLINRLLRLDSSAQQRLKPLQGKSLWLKLQELPEPLLFCFSDQIDIIVPQEPMPSQNPMADCCLELSLAVLPQLHDSSQISQLLKAEKLHLQGDIHVAQHFSHLLLDLDIDVEEKLSAYLGDVAAHSFTQGASRLQQTLAEAASSVAQMLSEGAIEEKKIAAPAIGVTHFCDEVSILRSDTARLEARLAQLEQQRQHK